MPTAEQLSDSGQLKALSHSVALRRRVVMDIYFGEQAEKWIMQKLASLKSDGFYDGVQTPKEQFVDVFRRMMTGENINDFPPKTLLEHPVWLHEVRTADLRIFGWFWRSNSFIATLICPKSDFSGKKITYSGCLETCRAHRNQLDLDPPKFIEGDINAILGS